MALPILSEQEAPFTIDDLHAMPDDGNRYELLFGEIVMSPSPGTKHQWVSVELGSTLREAARAAGWVVLIAPLDVHLGIQSVVQPDLFAFDPMGPAVVRPDGVHGPPTIVVEILSPATRGRDLVGKTVLYAAAGVPEYWIVDVDASTILVKQLRDATYDDTPNVDGIARSLVLPGLAVDIAALFDWPGWMNLA